MKSRQGSDQLGPMAAAELMDRAAAEFPNLTTAERILLGAAVRGVTADCAGADHDQRRDGRNRSTWGSDRVVRAELLRWLCVDPAAVGCVDLRGIAIRSARIAGRIDLAYVRLQFPITIAHSTLYEGIDLTHAESRIIALDGSYCGPIEAHGIAVRGGISIRGARLAAPIDISAAVISDHLDCGNARLLYRGGTGLTAEYSNIGGSVLLNGGFRAYGMVNLRGASIGDNLDCSGGAFFNRNRVALLANGIKIGGSATFGEGFRTNGIVSMQRATVASDLIFERAGFCGDQAGGADLSRASVEGRAVWMAIEQTPRTRLDVSDAHFDQIADQAASWPAPENFIVEGCRYNSIAPGFTQLEERLRMLRRQQPFAPQAYSALADALRRAGREHEALHVAIEREDQRREHEKMSFVGRCASRLFGIATGYGYKAYRVMWVPAFFVLAGWLLFSLGYREGVVLPATESVYEQFLISRTLPPSYPAFNPLIYSLDTFLPLTDFHQEDYWYPNPHRTCRSFQRPEPCGTVLHWYLAVHILAGWVFAILGLAGLLAKPPS